MDKVKSEVEEKPISRTFYGDKFDDLYKTGFEALSIIFNKKIGKIFFYRKRLDRNYIGKTRRNFPYV